MCVKVVTAKSWWIVSATRLGVAGLVVAGWKANSGELPGLRPNGSDKISNGWGINKIGTLIDLPGDYPQDVAFLKDGRCTLVITAPFNDHTLNRIDLQTG